METAMVGPTVKVFTAGEHFGSSDLSGSAEEFVQQLLNRSGYTKEYCWECRVDKLRHCSSESRPIRVIGFKSYGVVLRVKPYLTAAVDHQMTLYIPEGSGYSAKNLFEQLRANEKSISRVIRQKGNEKENNTVNTTQLHAPIQPAPVPAPPAATTTVKIHEPEGCRPEFKTLQGVVKNGHKLKYVLQKIQVVNNYNFCRNKVQFTETLRHECKWDKEGHSKGAVGRVLTELVKKDYLMETINERNKLIGYTLTEKGHFFIEKAIPSPPPTPPLKKEEPKVDISAILVNMKDKLQELADVANKIASNNAQKVELAERIARLDQENEELSKVFHQNKEAQEALSKLGNLINPLPVQGLRSTEISALHS